MYVHVSTSSLSLSLSLSLSFPLPYFTDSDQYQLGAVQSLEWSPIDYSVLAVAWTNGGLSMWSVFGSLLFHSLGNQPGLVIYSVSLSFPLSLPLSFSLNLSIVQLIMFVLHVHINVVYFIIIIIIYRTPTPLFRSQSTLLQSLVGVPGLSIFIISFSLHVGSSILFLVLLLSSISPSLPPSPRYGQWIPTSYGYYHVVSSYFNTLSWLILHQLVMAVGLMGRSSLLVAI